MCILVSIQHWTATYVSWSPLGSYLTTIHKQGVALWGGPSWKKVTQFAHPHVELIDYSPFGVEDEGHEIVIWDIRSGRLLRSFPYLSAPTPEGVKRKIFWPVFKWSPSDRYFARITPGTQISIYEAPSMGLLDKKSLKVDGVVDCPGHSYVYSGSRARQNKESVQCHGMQTSLAIEWRLPVRKGGQAHQNEKVIFHQLGNFQSSREGNSR